MAAIAGVPASGLLGVLLTAGNDLNGFHRVEPSYAALEKNIVRRGTDTACVNEILMKRLIEKITVFPSASEYGSSPPSMWMSWNKFFSRNPQTGYTGLRSLIALVSLAI